MKRLNIRITDEQYDLLTTVCDVEEKTVQEAVTTALQAWLDGKVSDGQFVAAARSRLQARLAALEGGDTS